MAGGAMLHGLYRYCNNIVDECRRQDEARQGLSGGEAVEQANEMRPGNARNGGSRCEDDGRLQQANQRKARGQPAPISDRSRPPHRAHPEWRRNGG
jgi:hypothetical protein